jgi:hypothetical protein
MSGSLSIVLLGLQHRVQRSWYCFACKPPKYRVDVFRIDMAPADVLFGRMEEILKRRKEVQLATIHRRRNYNQGLKDLATTI